MPERLSSTFCLSALLFLVAASAGAEPPPRADSSTTAESAADAKHATEEESVTEPDATGDEAPRTPIGNALRVWRDPATGRLTTRRPEGLPAPALSAEERASLRRDSEGLVVRTLPNGGHAVDLQGRFMNLAVVHFGEGSEKESSCITTATAATDGLTSHDAEAHASEKEARDVR